ncbi:hypothetical protein KL942_003143 [Ogataea angusta]|uniref:Single-stranded DNA-binding protein n=1 Tax=Pichia angusta TaxID=870730 RepID=A0AAN6DG87_PICAN|nr:uncharacterized protein KL928_003527 [Ogataea angusta]KAG7817628.1 hypothetical protein KL928_003527 [Ogataea angusta]KAG7822575.1 hypothetical protein KL909_003740 [Ogataea angusta]KAG7839532.1 hypothetical protein KL942_003143 [Ogataea angusta]KAG7845407.1 hypothetical protein KL941_003253 [Ogataea angusta]KAG7849165.1 hypothetical protein KL940_002847 [Ogataea angusta]
MLRLQARTFSSTARAQLAKINLIGTIGSDVTKATTSTGKEYVRYSLAVDSRSKNNDSTSWFNIACFNENQANFMSERLGKGARVYVEADVSNSLVEREDGSKYISWVLFQNTVEVLRFPKREEPAEAE